MWLLAACTPPVPNASSEVLAPPDVSGAQLADTGERRAESEPERLRDTGGPVATLPKIVLNEVQSRNASTWSGHDDSFPDWIEIYNADVTPIELSRLSLRDGGDVPWFGDGDAVLEPGAWLVISAGGGTEGGLVAPFRLDGGSERVTLMVDGFVTDRLDLGDLPEDVAWARYPDGGEWAPTVTCTPEGTNGNEPSATLDPGEALWDLDGFNDLNLIMTADAINMLTQNSYATVTAGAEINGVNVSKVNLRIRGSSTRRSFSSKASLKIDLNAHQDFRYRGLEKLMYINMCWDASYIREYVGYALFREMGVPAARTSYGRVSVNDELMGFYLFTETYDDAFLRHWYGNDDGYLWEANGDFYQGYGSYFDCEEGYPCDPEIINDIADILVESPTDANVEALEELVDLDNVLAEYAVETAIGQWDGYTSPHNFRVYWNPDTGKIQLIPSSIDLTFDNLYDYTVNPWYGNGRMFTWCTRNALCDERYQGIVLQLADTIEDMDWDTRIDQLEAVIGDEVTRDGNDPRSDFSSSQYTQQLAYVRSWMQTLPDILRAAVAAR